MTGEFTTGGCSPDSRFGQLRELLASIGPHTLDFCRGSGTPHVIGAQNIIYSQSMAFVGAGIHDVSL